MTRGIVLWEILMITKIDSNYFVNNNREVKNRVYGKRQKRDSRLCFLEKTTTWMRLVQNNSGRWCQRKTTQFRLQNENSEPQMWTKQGHLVISAVCRKRNSFKNLSNNSKTKQE